MDEPISPGLRRTFFVHFIIAGVVGLQHLLTPRVWTDFAGIVITETVTWRLIGAALLGFAASSWMAYREVAWERVKIVVAMEMIWSVLGALVILWGILMEGLPSLEWINVGILGAFAALFGYFFFSRAQ